MNDSEDGFVCGSGFDDAENASFTDVFATREEAIEAGQEDCGWIDGKTFETARIIHAHAEMPNPLDAEHACDCAENSDWGESLLEQWQDKVFAPGLIDELQAKLDEVWAAWVARHNLTIRCAHFEDVETHEFKDGEQ